MPQHAYYNNFVGPHLISAIQLTIALLALMILSNYDNMQHHFY